MQLAAERTIQTAATDNSIKPSGFRFWWQWTFSCALGELIGIGIAAVCAVLIFRLLGEPDTLLEKLVTLLTMVCAGSLEGASIGFFQWNVLRRKFPAITIRAWLTPTVSVAAFGWLVGMLYPTFLAEANSAQPDDVEMPACLIAVFAGVFGLLVGAMFGGAQWIVLRHHAQKAALWIVGNAFGWALALIWIYLAASLPTAHTSLPVTAVIGASAGILAGLSVGAVTGAFLLKFKPN